MKRLLERGIATFSVRALVRTEQAEQGLRNYLGGLLAWQFVHLGGVWKAWNQAMCPVSVLSQSSHALVACLLSLAGKNCTWVLFGRSAAAAHSPVVPSCHLQQHHFPAAQSHLKPLRLACPF